MLVMLATNWNVLPPSHWSCIVSPAICSVIFVCPAFSSPAIWCCIVQVLHFQSPRLSCLSSVVMAIDCTEHWQSLDHNKVYVSDRCSLVFQDVIGRALPRIGAYESLDNTHQVVALINDVSTCHFFFFFFDMTSHNEFFTIIIWRIIL